MILQVFCFLPIIEVMKIPDTVQQLLWLVLISLCYTNMSLGQSSGREQPGLYFTAGTGLSTHSSILLSSVATSNSTGYQFGFFGGKHDEYEAQVRSDTNSTVFAYASRDETSSLTTIFADNILRRYFGPAYLGIVISSSDITATLYEQPHLNLLATGFGANLGVNFEVSKKNALFLDITSASSSIVKDMVQVTDGTTTVALGSRTDISLGVISTIARGWLDFYLGYRQRSFSISVDGNSSAEIATATLLGLNLYSSW